MLISDPFESRHADSLRALDRGALRRLQAVLQDDDQDMRARIMRDLLEVPPSIGAQLIGQLVAISDTDRAARLELLRAIRGALDGLS